MPATKKVFVKTFGCQMNVYDSERMTEALGAYGYAGTTSAESADLVVLNTCHIREKAVEKVYSELGKIRDIKAERHALGLSTQVAVAGCVAQAEGAEISARAPVVDVVVGPQSYHRLPELLFRAKSEGRKVVETPPQAALPWKERAKNVRRALVCDADLTGRRIAVVDDVLTTGATLNELAGRGRCDLAGVEFDWGAMRSAGGAPLAPGYSRSPRRGEMP